MNTLERAANVIREILQNNHVQVEEIFLFGSRAHGTARSDSDWDLYVLVNHDLTFSDRSRLTTAIKRELARLRIPNDILLKNSQQFHQTKAYSGHLAHIVAKEGIPV